MNWEEGAERKAASPPPRISDLQEGKTRRKQEFLLGEGARGVNERARVPVSCRTREYLLF